MSNKVVQKFDRYAWVLAAALCLVSLVILAAAYRVGIQPSHYYSGASIGTTVSQGSAAVTVEKVAYTDGSGHFKAQPGTHYAIVTLTVRNNSSQPIYAAPASDTYVKTAAGDVSYLTPYELKKPFRSGEILPGEQTRGELSYITKKNTKQKYFIESDWSGGALSYLLQ